MLRIAIPKLTVSFAPYGDVHVRVCSKNLFDTIINVLSGSDDSEVLSCTSATIVNMPCRKPLISSCRAYLQRYIDAICDYCDENVDLLKVPERLEFDTEEKPKLKMPIFTFEENLVHCHTGLSFNEIGNLDIFTYRFYVAEACKLSILRRIDGTGTEYLNDCYNYAHQIDDDFYD